MTGSTYFMPSKVDVSLKVHRKTVIVLLSCIPELIARKVHLITHALVSDFKYGFPFPSKKYNRHLGNLVFTSLQWLARFAQFLLIDENSKNRSGAILRLRLSYFLF